MLIYNSGNYTVRDTEARKRKLKLGDRVKIKNLEIVKEVKNQGYDFPGHFNGLMEHYCGCYGKILDIERIGGEKYYRLDIDRLDWQWGEDMFEIEVASNLMENE